jgi:hypothetical protein
VGQTEQALGEIEREYIRHGHESMMGPLQRFLDGEMKNIVRERKILVRSQSCFRQFPKVGHYMYCRLRKKF